MEIEYPAPHIVDVKGRKLAVSLWEEEGYLSIDFPEDAKIYVDKSTGKLHLVAKNEEPLAHFRLFNGYQELAKEVFVKKNNEEDSTKAGRDA